MPTLNANNVSPARAWLQQLWQSQQKPTRINQRWSMRRALQSAIEMQLRFDLDDFVWMTTNTQSSYYDVSPFGRSWLGAGEQEYMQAIEARNMSAIKAIEHWKHRPAFLWAGQRLFVGRRVWWGAKNGYVQCTSFKADGSAVVLCSFTRPDVFRCAVCGGYANTEVPARVMHRYTLTPAQCCAAAPKVEKSTTVRS